MVFPYIPYIYSRIIQVSENLLTIYLDEYQQTPWDALKYLIAGVNYGGHVTDDWDRRLLTTYINQFFCEDAISTPYYRYTSNILQSLYNTIAFILGYLLYKLTISHTTGAYNPIRITLRFYRV